MDGLLDTMDSFISGVDKGHADTNNIMCGSIFPPPHGLLELLRPVLLEYGK